MVGVVFVVVVVRLVLPVVVFEAGLSTQRTHTHTHAHPDKHTLSVAISFMRGQLHAPLIFVIVLLLLVVVAAAAAVVSIFLSVTKKNPTLKTI